MNRTLYLRKLRNLRDQMDMLLMEGITDEVSEYIKTLYEIFKAAGSALLNNGTLSGAAHTIELHDAVNSLSGSRIQRACDSVSMGFKEFFSSNLSLSDKIYSLASRADDKLAKLLPYSQTGFKRTFSPDERVEEKAKKIGMVLCGIGCLIVLLTDESLGSKAKSAFQHSMSLDFRGLFNDAKELVQNNLFSSILIGLGMLLCVPTLLFGMEGFSVVIETLRMATRTIMRLAR